MLAKCLLGFGFLMKSKRQLRLINSRYGLEICVPEAAQDGQRCPARLLGQLQDAEHSQLSSTAAGVAGAWLHMGHNPLEELSPFIIISD